MVALSGCAGGETATSPTTSTTVPEPTTTSTTVGTTTSLSPQPTEALPPHTADELIDILGPIVEPLGFRVTRASLVDLTSYRASPTGSHLAVYVAPFEQLSAADHAEAVVALAAAYLPLVFDRWEGLGSFDICQEPHTWDLPGTPPAVTLLDLTRATSEDIDWDTVDLGDLIARALVDQHLTLRASDEVADSEPWRSAAGA